METKQAKNYKNPPEVRAVLAKLRREQRAKKKASAPRLTRKDAPTLDNSTREMPDETSRS